MDLCPSTTPLQPASPAGRRHRRKMPDLLSLGGCLGAAMALLGAPASAGAERAAAPPEAVEDQGPSSEPDWMVWLEDFGFCPSMDCGPRRGRPRMRVCATIVAGALSRETIRHYVRAQGNRFRSCYESELRRQPDLQGRLAVRFHVSSAGEVVLAKTESSTFYAPDLEACLAEAFSSISFPAVDHGGGYVVTYPLTFRRAAPP